MAFCANCGTEVTGRFCAKCGTPVAGANPAEPSSATPPPEAGAQSHTQPEYGQAGYAQSGYTQGNYVPPPPATAQAPGLTDNMASALCYLAGWLTGVLFLILAPYNQNRAVRFHAFQSIFASIGVIIIWIAVFIVTTPLTYIPFIGWAISALLHFAVWVGMFIGWLYLMYKAYNNQRVVVPIVGPMAEKQA